MSQFALQNLSIEALEPALEDIRSHLQEMGLTLHVLNGAGAVIAKSTGCPLAELGGCGIASHVSKLAWTATNTSKMAQCTTQCGCRAVSLPILQRRRLVGTASVCFPVQETTRSKELAEHCKNKKLDYFKTRKLVRNVARYRSSDMDNIANMLNWILRREQSISAADHELKSLSFNLSNTYEELSLLYMISGYMHVTGKPQDFLQIVCNDLREVINLEAAVGVIYPRNPEITDEITVIAGSVDLNEDQIKILKSTYVMPMLKKSDGTVLANRCEIDPESGLGNKIQNLIVVPLVIDSNHSGMLIGINKQRNLMGAKSTLDLQSIDFFRTGPAFGRIEDDHWPAWPGGILFVSCITLYLPDFLYNLFQTSGHKLMYFLRLIAFNKVRFPAITM